MAAPSSPNVVCLMPPGVDRWPGLEPVADEASLVRVGDDEGLAVALPSADVLLVTDHPDPPLRRCWDRAERLQWVHCTRAGVESLLFPELVASDVTLTNGKGILDRALAEYVIGLILAHAKDLPRTVREQQARRWVHRDTRTVHGARLVVVGAGGIGREVARLARGLELESVGVARSAREWAAPFERVVGAADLLDEVAAADYVVITVPLTKQTRGMVSAEFFAAMQPSAWFINVARSEVVDTAALRRALTDGKIAGAALDVFDEEPLRADDPLWSAPNVLVSPHMAGDFVGWQEAQSAQFVENFRRWCVGKELLNVIDKKEGYVQS